ncbi:MAG: rod shape-determining protein MreC [Puniceicoccales bacterium]|nr:rod shape-determining protein MreC [Puniceicoccales bacterium]
MKTSKRFADSCFPVESKKRNVIGGFAPLLFVAALMWILPATLKKDIRAAFEYVQAPFNLSVNWLGKIENSLKTDTISRRKLIAICEDLMREISFLRLELSVLQEKSMDGGESYELENFTLKPARVIRRDIATWANELTIDAGSDNGIRDGMGVISKNYVVGRVKSTTPATSTVELVTSPAFRMVVHAAGDTEMNPIVFSGNGQAFINRATGVATNIPLSVLQGGEKITLVTSPLSGIFPKNITIGTVNSTGIIGENRKRFSTKVTLDGELLSKIYEVSVLINRGDGR